MIGTSLRFFSNRVFGVWVDATVSAIGPKWITLSAYHHGVEWTEKVGRMTEFYRPAEHPERGEAFRLFPKED